MKKEYELVLVKEVTRETTCKKCCFDSILGCKKPDKLNCASDSLNGYFRVKQKLATIRKDLLKKKLSVPIGKTYYSSGNPLPYRYKKEQFQVKFNNKWQNAESIDFDFN